MLLLLIVCTFGILVQDKYPYPPLLYVPFVAPVIVGICDSGEPSIYMSKEGLLAIGAGGYEVVTLSEFKRLSGFDPEYELLPGQCIIMGHNAGTNYFDGAVLSTRSGYTFIIKETIYRTPISTEIMAILIILLKIWDGINDPLMGTIIDAAHFKWGKFKPWIMLGAVLTGIILLLMFNLMFPPVWVMPFLKFLSQVFYSQSFGCKHYDKMI